jgi:sulfiredoxin
VLLKTVDIAVDDIYVPVRLRETLDAGKVDALAESILEEGLKVPIRVRQGKGRYVLVAGLHRLEALRALGESTVQALIVQASRG